WHFTPVTICIKHNIHLINCCPSCDQPVLVLHRHSIAGYCPRRYSWLGNNKGIRKYYSEEIGWYRWVCDNLGDMVSKKEFPQSRASYLQKIIQSIVNQVTDGNITQFGRLLGLPKNTVWTWINSNTLPSLDQL